ncbi:MAG: ATP:cob(I)alamin adenosyltransferase [FCB group bacterium]|nr:ATP:cob(I)alamin adenosyltransferase [FCB group bacterium]
MKSQVTTKRGDQGNTTALSGDSYPKSHVIMECVGGIDELRAHTALARLMILRERGDDGKEVGDFLFWLLHTYFLIGSACSDPLDKHLEYRWDNLAKKHIDILEREQLRIEALTKLPHAFIVSAANELAAQIDVTCTVARRLERAVVRLKEAVPEWRSDDIMVFLNRLSDYLYMLARYLENGQHISVDYAVLEHR